MVKDETSERSAELLRLALPLMSKHADGFKPISYAVWYEYVAGSNSALKQEVEASIQGGNRMSSSVTFDLYRKHMIDRDEQAVNNARSGLLDVLGKMQSSVADANSQTEGFNADLEQFGRKLSETDNRDELLGNVSEMLDKAQQMGASLNELQSDFVQGQTEVQRLTEELNRMRQEVQTDPLTGLMNRRGFDGALKALTDRAQADQTELCMLMIDIDHFKKVNDSFGHLFGDQVIRGVAQAIKGLVKGQDVGARYGGEEFAVPACARFTPSNFD